MWKKIGLNLQEEIIEEENESKLRRVRTSAGYLIEGVPNIRFGRITNLEDQNNFIKSFSYPHILNSYDNLDDAILFWFGNKNAVNKIKKMIDLELCKKVWYATIKNQWNDNLPDWQKSIYKKGIFDWPLYVDIGIYKKYYKGKDLSLEEYKKWFLEQNEKNNLIVGLNLTEGYKVGQYFINGSFINKKQKEEITIEQWAGIKPEKQIEQIWESGYISFSSLDNTITGYVDPLLNQALNNARPNLTALEIREFIAKEMGIDTEQLNERLSSDQIDAVYLALKQLQNNNSFLLGDETGYGKGRILASIAAIAYNKGIQVLFFTEKKALMSDFYRDCNVLFNEVPVPIIMHSTAKVLKPNGEVAFNKKCNRLPVIGDKIVWTTYSQFNRKNKERLNAVNSWMKNTATWVLMDEAQNAAGDSNTGKILKDILKVSKGVVFSSATFAKNENQLLAYKRLFIGKKYEWDRLISAFSSDSDLLRAAITLMWAEQGVFLRREHPPIELPNCLWVKSNDNIINQNDLYSSWWRSMLNCAKIWSQALDKLEGGWGKLGGHLSRANREFSLLQKKDYLVDEIIKSINNNQKPVIVADWTLSSHVNRLITKKNLEKQNIETDKDVEDVSVKEEIDLSDEGVVFDSVPLWKDSWKIIIDEIFPDEEIKSHHPLANKMRSLKEKAIDCLYKLPNWSASPFDDVISALEQKNIKIAEISGRNWNLKQIDDKWIVSKRVQINRSEIVNTFNNGEADVTLITRAGNSGLSLHSGKLFKDQRQRHLIEWDVAPDPSVRIQFLGRVRRKDQVCEPERSTILIDTPYERRRLNRDTVKQIKLSSHSGKTKDNFISWIGKEGSFVVKEIMSVHPSARSVLDPGPEVDVEKVLSRSVVLYEQDRLMIVSQLERGVELFNDWFPKRNKIWDKSSRVVRQRWIWGSGDHSLNWQERVWSPRKRVDKEVVFDELKQHFAGKSKELNELLANWKNCWDKWFASQPHQKTKGREQLLNYWLSKNDFKRGAAIEAIDPNTFEKSYGIILGFEGPDFNDPTLWSASQIKMTVWLSSMDKPMSLSLSAWISKNYGNLTILNKAPSPSWFDNSLVPTKSMVLVGPPWSIAAWAARFTNKGELIKLLNEDGTTEWGIKMPETFKWEDMLKLNIELAGVKQAKYFIKANPYDNLIWRWEHNLSIVLTPQADGILMQGKEISLSCLTQPLLKKTSVLKWDDVNKIWYTILPWDEMDWAFYHWFAMGGIPTVDVKFYDWFKNNWNNFEDK